MPVCACWARAAGSSARTLPKTISITLAVVALFVALFVWPADFNVQSKGSLEPVGAATCSPKWTAWWSTWRSITRAGYEGRVARATSQHRGGEGSEHGHRAARRLGRASPLAATRALGERPLRPEEKARYSGELAEEKEKLAAFNAQLVLCRERIAQLQVRSPIDGLVVTWDLKNRLIRKPVQRRADAAARGRPRGPLATRAAHARGPHGIHRRRAGEVEPRE